MVCENCESKYECFSAYVKHFDIDKWIVDCLHHATNNTDCKWKYPSIDDIQEAELEQIVDCDVGVH